MVDFIQAPGTLPPGQRIYAVGDVHGCFERLEALHALVAEDLESRPTAEPLLLHLGDYVDRGPNSAAVVAKLAAGSPVTQMPTVNLMGNHEEMMLSAVATGDSDATGLWLANGGADSLLSWRVPRSAQPKEWPSYLPMAHLIFLRDLAPSYEAGDYLFVHAGIRPGIPLNRQTRHDLMWIREPFLSFSESFGPVVVHGHTPRQEPTVRFNRIGIDTGAVMGGVLTCAVLEEDRLGFITA